MLLTTVTNLADTGAGSLREAVALTPAGGLIDFQTGLTGTITLTSGELVINNSLTIKGSGAASIAVSGGNTSRVFDFPLTTSNVSLSGLTIENGNAVSPAGTTAGWGGAISNLGTLSISNCVLTGNFASFGGGAINDWGPLTISGSTFSNNTTTPSLGGGGGGIYSSRGTLSISSSTFTGNSGQQGGAIITNSGSLNIDGSTFSNNIAGVGGGVFNVFGTGTISNSTFSANSASISAGFVGGGIANSGGGTLSVVGCTLMGNSAGTSTILGGGGGIYNQDSTLTLSSSTLSGNSANWGGALDNHYSVSATVMTVNNSTISGNTAATAGGVSNIVFGVAASGTLNIFDSIIAGNTAPSAPDVSGIMASQGHNLIGNGTSGSGFVASDLVGTATTPINPNLGPLQNNGGPTQTMALLANSPAINAGDNTGASQWDQRGTGFARIVGGTIDIGAYEAQTPLVLISPSVSVNPITITYGTSLSNSQLTGTSTTTVNGQVVNVPGSFSFKTAAGTILNAGNGQTEQVTFTPTDTATYSSVQTSVTVNVQQATPSVTWSNPAAITYGTSLSATQLNASSNVPGTFVYTPASGVTVGAGTQTLSVTFTPTDTVDYRSVISSVQLIVNQATPVFSNLSSPTIVAGTASTTLSGLLASGAVYPTGGSVTVTVNGTVLTATVTASGTFSVSLPTTTLAVGNYPITYSFAGDANFASASGTGTLAVTAIVSLNAVGVNVNAVAGTPFTSAVATFTNPNPNGTTATYSAVIDWGDGTTSIGVISATGSLFTVTGTHTYATAGTDTIHVTIVDKLGLISSATTTSKATVTAAVTTGKNDDAGEVETTQDKIEKAVAVKVKGHK